MQRQELVLRGNAPHKSSTHLYPLERHTWAKPIPVLPAVPSTTVPPGFSLWGTEEIGVGIRNGTRRLRHRRVNGLTDLSLRRL